MTISPFKVVFMTRPTNLLAIFFFLASNLCGRIASAQIDQSLNVFGYKLLDYRQDYLPETLLSERSAVLVHVLPRHNGARGDWKGLCAKAHPYFNKIGIDPVAYLYNEDVFSGEEPRRSFIKWFEDRKIVNLIFLSERMTNGQKEFLISITTFKGGNNLAENGQPAWCYRNPDLERLFIVLYRLSSELSLKKENFLIVDKPEYFNDIPLAPGKRFEAFQPDLKLDKLAVPRFEKIDIPAIYLKNPLNQEIAAEAEKYNLMVDQMNQRFEQLMAHYPFSFEFVNLSQKTREQLRKEGFQFILFHINSSGRSIREMLDYRIDRTETAFASMLASESGTSVKPISADVPVYKFYIRHILTNDVFLGTTWDSDNNWEQALQNHLHGMKLDLKASK